MDLETIIAAATAAANRHKLPEVERLLVVAATIVAAATATMAGQSPDEVDLDEAAETAAKLQRSARPLYREVAKLAESAN